MKRKELSLKEKIALIKDSTGRSQRQLAEKYEIGKTQVHGILKRKRELMESYEEGRSQDAKRLCKRAPHEEVNKLMWEWFQRARSHGIPISGPMLQEKALMFAVQLGISPDDFKASNGWLSRFRQRHGINFASVCGESRSVSQDTVDQWKDRLPEIIEGYAMRDIFNMDETGLFFRALPDKSLSIRGEDCKGGKRSKERLTVVLCVNMVGEFEKTLVIGKSEKPRCFKNINSNNLPVTWTFNKKAWMNSGVFTDWIKNLDRRMRQAGRHILLFMDNAPSHPKDVKLTNVKTIFFPANTTSVLQPLDQGIIQNMKQLYRKRLVRSVIAKVDDAESGVSSEAVTKSVSVLDAVQWVYNSVNDIKSETVTKCFLKSGISPLGRDDLNTEDDEEENMPLSELADLIKTAQDKINFTEVMSESEFLSVDDNIPVHEECDENWEEDLVNNLLENGEKEEVTQESDELEECDGPELNITSSSEASKCLEQLKLFCFSKDMGDLALELIKLQDNFEKQSVKIKSGATQTTLDKFFKK